MRELGQFLRTKRESLGLSLDEVQEKTKIRKRYLIALENGDWSVLPGYVYGRGFVRSYAEVLGIDGLELLQKFLGMSSDANDEEVEIKQNQLKKPVVAQEPLITKTKPKQVNLDQRNLPEEPLHSHKETTDQIKKVLRTRERIPSPATRLLSGRKFNTLSQVAVVIGVLAIIGGSLYALERGKGQTNLPGGNSLASGFTQNEVNSTNSSQQGTNNTGVSGLANASNNATQNTTKGSGQNQSAGTASIIPAAFQNNSQSYTVVTSDPLSVSLTAASGDCWVKVSADNSIIDGSDMISQGMKKTWSAGQSITIRVGNVPAVQLEANGQPVTLPQTTNAIDITFVKQQAQAQQ